MGKKKEYSLLKAVKRLSREQFSDMPLGKVHVMKDKNYYERQRISRWQDLLEEEDDSEVVWFFDELMEE